MGRLCCDRGATPRAAAAVAADAADAPRGSVEAAGLHAGFSEIPETDGAPLGFTAAPPLMCAAALRGAALATRGLAVGPAAAVVEQQPPS